MTEQEDKGFKVIDRRGSANEESPTAEGAKAPGGEAKSDAQQQVEGPGWQMREKPEPKALPPMDFTTFCLSLASSAMVHLGHAPNPDTGESEANLPLAKQTIDILVLLEDKTRGNLSAEESKLLATLLYDLRMRFVQASRS